MAQDILTDIDLKNNSILQAVLHPVGSDPSTPSDGQVWYRTDTDVLMLRAAGASVAISTAAGGIGNVVEDTTPQLGGNLDVGNFALTDGLTREIVSFVKDASAVNQIEIENEATAGNPILRGTGDDANVGIAFESKGSGTFDFGGNITVTGTVDGRDIDADGTDLDDLVSLSGVAANSTDFGTFTGTTITDATALKAILQELETAIEAMSGVTNLTWTAATSTIASSTGTDAVITVVDGSNDGLMVVADKTKLDAITGTNTGDEPDASTTVKGIIEIADQTETSAGASTVLAVTPATLDGYVLAGGSLSGTIGGATVNNNSHTHNDSTIDSLDTSAVTTGTFAAARIPTATTTAAGAAEIATQVEVDAGAIDTHIVTPAKLDALNVTGMTWFIDEDNMATDSPTRLPSQQSVKAYVDGAVTSALTYQGAYNASTDTPALDTGTPSITVGDVYTVTVAGTFFTVPLDVGDVLIAEVTSADAADVGDWTIVSKQLDLATTTTSGIVELATQAEADAGSPADVAVTAATLAGFALTGDLGGTLGSPTVDAASDTVAGKIEIATQAEVDTGSSTTQAVTPGRLFGGVTSDGSRVARVFAVDCATAATTTATHNLGSTDVVVQVFDTTTGYTVTAQVDRTGANAVDVTISPTPTAGDYRIVVTG